MGKCTDVNEIPLYKKAAQRAANTQAQGVYKSTLYELLSLYRIKNSHVFLWQNSDLDAVQGP
jgi:hypothetical protein